MQLNGSQIIVECTEDNKPLCEKRTLTFKIDDKGLNVS